MATNELFIKVQSLSDLMLMFWPLLLLPYFGATVH